MAMRVHTLARNKEALCRESSTKFDKITQKPPLGGIKIQEQEKSKQAFPEAFVLGLRELWRLKSQGLNYFRKKKIKKTR